jgi:galacturonosyltransferase
MKKKVLILVNHNVVIYNFRKELVQRLVSDGYEVYLSCPQGNRIEELKRMECKYIETDVERRSLNPFTDLSLLRHYKKIMREIKPDVVLTYTIKPNIYGGMAARKYNIPQLANITGLGTSIEDGGISSKFILQLYKYGIKSARTVFFQNQTNLDFFKRQGLVRDNYALIPGSGVNLTENYFEPYPEETNKTVLLIIGRMMKNKGTGEILEAAEEIRKRRKDVIFRFIGLRCGAVSLNLSLYITAAVSTGFIRSCATAVRIMHAVRTYRLCIRSAAGICKSRLEIS